MSAAVIDSEQARRRATAKRLRDVYAITPELSDTHDLVMRVDAALAGGATAIQYRNKALTADECGAQAAALVPVVRKHGALLIVNDYPDIAARVGADGVHIGEDDASIDLAREQVGPHCIVGVSCYNDFRRAELAVAAGADYIAFGSFFASPVKPQARRADISLLARARSFEPLVVAIGGITVDNAGELARAGADAVAVISAVFGSADPARIEAATRALCAVMASNKR